MKKTVLYPFKRFLSILIFDKDISEAENKEKAVTSPVHPIFLEKIPQTDISHVSIQPEEI